MSEEPPSHLSRTGKPSLRTCACRKGSSANRHGYRSAIRKASPALSGLCARLLAIRVRCAKRSSIRAWCAKSHTLRTLLPQLPVTGARIDSVFATCTRIDFHFAHDTRIKRHFAHTARIVVVSAQHDRTPWLFARRPCIAVGIFVRPPQPPERRSAQDSRMPANRRARKMVRRSTAQLSN